MKKFLLFAGHDYYPAGGIGDYKGDFDTIEEAKAFLSESRYGYDWSDIVDYETMQEVTPPCVTTKS